MDFYITFYNPLIDDTVSIFFSSFLEPYSSDWFTDLYEVASGYCSDDFWITPGNGWFVTEVEKVD